LVFVRRRRVQVYRTLVHANFPVQRASFALGDGKFIRGHASFIQATTAREVLLDGLRLDLQNIARTARAIGGFIFVFFWLFSFGLPLLLRLLFRLDRHKSNAVDKVSKAE
jgi:hypothetical protein